MNQIPEDLKIILDEHAAAAGAYQQLDLGSATELEMDRAADRLDAATAAIQKYVEGLRAIRDTVSR